MKYSTPCFVYGFWLLLFLVSCNRELREYGPKEYEALRDGFIDPTGTARPKVYWWWLNGYSDTVRIKEELKAIKAAGLGGVDLFEIGVPPVNNPGGMIKPGPAFMSPTSLENIVFALREASKLDLEVGLNLASSWNAGGTWVTPENAAKTIYHSQTTLKGGAIRDFSLPFPSITDKSGNPRTIEYGPDKKPAFYEEIAVLAIPSNIKSQLDTSRVIDITPYFDKKNEKLTWEAPMGDWDIYRFVCSNSGEQLLRPSENSKGPIIDHFDAGATEMHLNYFLDKLQPKIGKFPKSALKYLYLASYEAKDFAWTQTLPKEFASLNGYPVVKFLPGLIHPELYDPETWRRFYHDYAETFSELMIQNHNGKAREIANAHGLNIISESGEYGHPGIVYFAGTHFNDKRVWWPKVKPFTDYLSRVSYILQNTDFVSDVLYYYGEEIPNLVPPKNPRFMVGAGESLDKGGAYENLTLLKALEGISIVPDFDYSDNHPDQRMAPLDFIHYRKGSLDFYFIRNTTDRWITRDCFFRQVGKKPEIWYPISGFTVPVTVSEESKSQTRLPVSLAPYGSALVVFSPGKTNILAKEIKNGDGNTWSNRLTGDAITGENFTETNIVKANKNLVPWKELPLKKSGLFGPVEIISIKPLSL